MINPLPYILTLVTQKPRSKVDIVWSDKSWVHNVFRFYELLFWRKDGIRPELSTMLYTENGADKIEYRFHSFEAVCAHVETLARAVKIPRFKFVKVYMPQLAMVGNVANLFPSPYLFAIVHDADATPSITNAFGGTATKTFSHTVTGTNNIIIGTYALWQDVAGTGTVTANTYNAITLVKSDGIASASMRSELWYLKVPSTGANTVSVTVTGNTDAIKLCTSSYTGVDQTAPLDAHATATGSTGNPVASVTSVSADCLVVAVLSRFSTTAATSNKTSIFNNVTGSILGAAAYEITSGAAGSKSNTYTGTSANDWSMCIGAFKPTGGGVVANTSSFLMFFGN